MTTAKKMGNYICIPREVFEVDKFGREPYSKREAFLDLVQMAAYEDSETFINGYRYERSRGDVIVSKSFLSKRWGWSVDKVRRYTTYLERNGWCKCRCDDQCNQPITLISIVSYDLYQGCTTTPNTTDEATPATTSGSTTSTQYKEKEKEETNNKTNSSRRFVKPTVEQIAAYCKEKGYDVEAERFFNYYESKGWVVGKAPMKDWKSAVRNWVTMEKERMGQKPQAAPEIPRDEAMRKAMNPTKEETDGFYRKTFAPQHPALDGEGRDAYWKRVGGIWEKEYKAWIGRRVDAVNNRY